MSNSQTQSNFTFTINGKDPILDRMDKIINLLDRVIAIQERTTDKLTELENEITKRPLPDDTSL